VTPGERAYYDQRAPEYDDFYLGRGLFAERLRPGWQAGLAQIVQVVASLRARTVLDVACGTGYLTRYLNGCVTALDQSMRMLGIARERLPAASLVLGDGLRLPFRSQAFECLLASHFYGHLREDARQNFLQQARRVTGQMVVIDAACREGVDAEQVQDRVLQDGTRHTVYKRYFMAEQLARELGGGKVLYADAWFVAVEA
jgi:demethylmenaquinone methyltransferase/2-methoxy-6-polyprenyl-1,4-benzoquinol methylase